MTTVIAYTSRRFFRRNVGSTVYRAAFDKTDVDNGDNGTYVVNQDIWR